MRRELTMKEMELVSGVDSFGLTREQWREVIDQILREEHEKSSK